MWKIIVYLPIGVLIMTNPVNQLIRKCTFETNSSSCHSLVISCDPTMASKIVDFKLDKHGDIHIQPKYYDQESFCLKDFQSKLPYVIAQVFYDEEALLDVLKLLKQITTCNDIYFKNVCLYDENDNFHEEEYEQLCFDLEYKECGVDADSFHMFETAKDGTVDLDLIKDVLFNPDFIIFQDRALIKDEIEKMREDMVNHIKTELDQDKVKPFIEFVSYLSYDHILDMCNNDDEHIYLFNKTPNYESFNLEKYPLNEQDYVTSSDKFNHMNNEEKQHLKMICTGYYSLNKFLKYLKQFCQNNNIQYNQEKLDAMLIQQYKIDRNLDDNNPNISVIGKKRKKEKLEQLNQSPEKVIQEYVEDRFSFRYPQESDNEKYSLLLQVTLLYRLIIEWFGLYGKYRYNENNIQYSIAIIE